MKTKNKTYITLTAMSALILLCLSPLSAQSKSTKLAHQTEDKNAPVVYFTRDVSAAGLMKVYNALNQKKQGKVGIKVSFGAPDEDVLNPELLTSLIKATDGTMLDSCGLSGNRWTPELNLSHAKKHGFDKVGPMQMLDENGDIDMPVKNGYLLKYARTGSHFDEYDTLISVFKFRMHFLPALDGAIKNVTLCLESRSGKCLIHSGGTDPNHYHDTKPDILEKSFADALRAALDYKDNWAFINVIDSYEPEDSCKGTKNTGNIGIIASYDPVAIDQCSVDFVAETAETAELRAQWEETHQVKVLEYAEKLGCGKRNYRLFGEVWNESAIDVKTKCIITVVSLMASRITDSSLTYHLQNAKAHGVTKEEIAAIIIHATMYTGWPKGWAVFRLAKEVWKENEPATNEKDRYQNSIFFPIGEPNPYGKYFVGQSYLAQISKEQIPVFNVTFEPGCRNNWHIHKAKSGGGQMLICVGGRGWYQEEGKNAVELLPGSVVNIPVGVKHWHGAAKDSWFSHLALEIPGEDGSTTWCEPVSEEDYGNLK